MPQQPGSGPDWSLLRSFASVMRLGTLSAAAHALGQSQPTIGRHIRELETVTGEPLFARRGNLLTPTPRAAELFERVAPMEDAGFAVARLIAGTRDAEAGTVRISVPEVFGVHIVPGLIAAFLAAHPGMAVEVSATNSTDDLSRREADIAVRLFRPGQPDLIMRKAGGMEVGVYASQGYLARHGEPSSAMDFVRHRLVGDDQSGRLLKAMQDYGMPVTRDSFVYRTDSILGQIAAVEAGVGIGAFISASVHGRPLIRLLADTVAIRFDVHVVAHGDLHRSRRMRLMFDHLAEGLQRELSAER
jgi:DNA-binding transcriptional LysR family regulator